MNTSDRGEVALGIVGVSAGLLLWFVLAAIADSESIVPGPFRTVSSALSLIRDGYVIDLAATTGRSIVAWAVALLVGVPAGLLLGLSARSMAASRGVLAFARSLPAFMLITIPVALRFGGELSRIGTTTFACLVVVIDATAEALSHRSRDRSDIFRVYGAGRFFTATRLLFFEALGQVIVPMARTIVGLSFVVTIVCETLVIPASGIGARLGTALGEADLTRVYAFLLLTGLSASLLNYLTVLIARKSVYWS